MNIDVLRRNEATRSGPVSFVMIVPSSLPLDGGVFERVVQDWMAMTRSLPNIGVDPAFKGKFHIFEGQITLLEGGELPTQGFLIHGILPWDAETSVERAAVLASLLCAHLKVKRVELLLAGEKFTIEAKQ